MDRPGLNTRITVPDGHGGTRTLPLWERIVEAVRATGMDYDVGAGIARVHGRTFRAWIARGETCLERYAGGHHLDAEDTAYAEFVLNLEAAAAEWETRQNTTLERLAQGNIPQVIVTEKVERVVNLEGDVIGEEVVRTTRSTTTLPDAATLRWMLERKRRQRYSPQVAITGPEGAPLGAVGGEDLLAEIRAYTQGLADAAARKVPANGNGAHPEPEG